MAAPRVRYRTVSVFTEHLVALTPSSWIDLAGTKPEKLLGRDNHLAALGRSTINRVICGICIGQARRMPTANLIQN
jgi:hypothetical protein